MSQRTLLALIGLSLNPHADSWVRERIFLAFLAIKRWQIFINVYRYKDVFLFLTRPNEKTKHLSRLLGLRVSESQRVFLRT